jgi:hypothetical protein
MCLSDRFRLEQVEIAIAHHRNFAERVNAIDFWRVMSGRYQAIGTSPNAIRPRRCGCCGNCFGARTLCRDNRRRQTNPTAALREIGVSGLHDHGLRANNRAKNSHQPLRRRERKMQGFFSALGAAIRFIARGGLQHIQRATAFNQPSHAPTISDRSTYILELCDSCGRIIEALGSRFLSPAC